MREFKTSQTSTVHPASSSLHPFLWRWKVSFHQFNIQRRLIFSPSSPNKLKKVFISLPHLTSLFSVETEGLLPPVQHSTSPPLQPIIP
ncbi:hypothetical protein AVEN_75333-1 [Araneus ventricosus]|uniref:Uncharacterized protein n=1 Tax=Araneus ventricosus TaxID=182803 RepID=A0A4Y2JGF9_ARAVE|nr:hypothetical protein AVEN_75333-1 [Araneus ventricosus]